MSRIYNDTNILCSCAKKGKQIDPELVKHVSELYFCPWCQIVKCETCCVMSYTTKYCPSCLTIYTSNETHCAKSCFKCPQCSSRLSMKASNAETGKFFTFHCRYCPFNYETASVSKPRPIPSIIEEERLSKDTHARLFTDFAKNLTRKPEKSLPDDVLEKMNKLNLGHLAKPKETIHSVPLDVNKEKERSSSVAQIKKLDDFTPLKQRLQSIDIYNPLCKSSYPIPMKLVIKKKLKCSKCFNELLVPNADSIKFDRKLNLIDFVPDVHLKQADGNISLKLINYTESPLDVSIDTFVSVKEVFISAKGVNVNVNLPVTNVQLEVKSSCLIPVKLDIKHSETENKGKEFTISLPFKFSIKSKPASISKDLSFSYWNIVHIPFNNPY